MVGPDSQPWLCWQMFVAGIAQRERERERASEHTLGQWVVLQQSVFPEKWKGTFARVAGALTN